LYAVYDSTALHTFQGRQDTAIQPLHNTYLEAWLSFIPHHDVLRRSVIREDTTAIYQWWALFDDTCSQRKGHWERQVGWNNFIDWQTQRKSAETSTDASKYPKRKPSQCAQPIGPNSYPGPCAVFIILQNAVRLPLVWWATLGAVRPSIKPSRELEEDGSAREMSSW